MDEFIESDITITESMEPENAIVFGGDNNVSKLTDKSIFIGGNEITYGDEMKSHIDFALARAQAKSPLGNVLKWHGQRVAELTADQPNLGEIWRDAVVNSPASDALISAINTLAHSLDELESPAAISRAIRGGFGVSIPPRDDPLAGESRRFLACFGIRGAACELRAELLLEPAKLYALLIQYAEYLNGYRTTIAFSADTAAIDTAYAKIADFKVNTADVNSLYKSAAVYEQWFMDAAQYANYLNGIIKK